MSRITITMLIACFGTLIPAWIASALLEQLNTEIFLHESPTGISILILFAISFWGTSFAYMYNKKIKYAILSGLGKWAIVVIGIWIFYATSNPHDQHHPYIIFIGIMFAFIWGMIDFGMVYYLAKKRTLDS